KGLVRKMRGLGLRHRRHDALRREPVPDRRQFRKHRAVAVALQILGAPDMLKPIGAWEITIEIIEAAVLGVEDDDRLDLVDAGRRGQRPRAVRDDERGGKKKGSTHDRLAGWRRRNLATAR